ncbi:hypothetical protein PG988_006350 [Apiospora saccharicola]
MPGVPAWGGIKSSTSSTPAVAGLSRAAWFANKPAPPQNPFLFPPSSVVAATPFGTPRKEGQQPRAFENQGNGGSAPIYPDHYSPAGDKVRLCRELRRNSLAMTPRKLNGVLDCLEGVNRLQEQLIRARRELTNLAIFGNKHGQEPQRGPAAAALARSPAARRWKKNNKRRARTGTGGAGGASRHAAKRKQQGRRARERRAEAPAVRPDDKPASPEVEIKLEEQDYAIRAPLRDIAPPNRAMVQRLNWQKLLSLVGTLVVPSRDGPLQSRDDPVPLGHNLALTGARPAVDPGVAATGPGPDAAPVEMAQDAARHECGEEACHVEQVPDVAVVEEP